MLTALHEEPHSDACAQPAQAEAPSDAMSACTNPHTKMQSKLYSCLPCAAVTNSRPAAACLECAHLRSQTKHMPNLLLALQGGPAADAEAC